MQGYWFCTDLEERVPPIESPSPHPTTPGLRYIHINFILYYTLLITSPGMLLNVLSEGTGLGKSSSKFSSGPSYPETSATIGLKNY